jgi:hypothetical protein
MPKKRLWYGTSRVIPVKNLFDLVKHLRGDVTIAPALLGTDLPEEEDEEC